MEWQGSKEEFNKSCGIYAILDGDKIIYIGSTGYPFYKRFQAHDKHFKNHSKEQKLYSYHPQSNLYMKPLICLDKVRYTGKTEEEILKNREFMEWALILAIQPECNVAGVITPFHFSKEKKKEKVTRLPPSKHFIKTKRVTSPW